MDIHIGVKLVEGMLAYASKSDKSFNLKRMRSGLPVIKLKGSIILTERLTFYLKHNRVEKSMQGFLGSTCINVAGTFGVFRLIFAWL